MKKHAICFLAIVLLVMTSMGCQSSRPQNGFENGHEWVDLGLPSGLKWATCNVGASSPTDFGGYYPWAGVEDANQTGEYYTYFDRANWVYTKYTKESGVFRLNPSDDVAHVTWSGKWRMPTKADFEELKAKCRYKWVVENGVEGMRFTSKKNGNSLFLPAAGSTSDPTNIGYWSSELVLEEYSSDESAYCMLLGSYGGVLTDISYSRYTCYPVRPVTE